MIPILHLSAHFLATCNCKARYSWKKLTIMHTFSDTIRMITLIKIMIEFLFSSFKALLPTFSYKLSRWVSFCPDGVSLCPKYHHQPLFFSQLSQNPLGICRYLKHPQPHPKTPLFQPELESGQIELPSGQNGHQLGPGKMFEKWAKLKQAKNNYSYKIEICIFNIMLC